MKRKNKNFTSLSEHQKKEIERIFFSEIENGDSTIAKKVNSTTGTVGAYIVYLLDKKFNALNEKIKNGTHEF